VAKSLTPLQGIAILTGEPEARVLFCSSPEAKVAAASVLKAYAAVACDSSPDRTDYAPLRNRMVDIWAPGGTAGAEWAASIAARIVGVAQRVRVVDNSEWDDGRDLPQLVGEGWTEDQALKWASEHIKVVERSNVVELKRKHPSTRPAPHVVSTIPPSALAACQAMGLAVDEKQQPHPTLANVALIIQKHPDIAGKIWFDAFRGQLRTTLHGQEREWTDADDTALTVWIQQQLSLHRVGLTVVKDSVQHAARCDTRNSLTDWLSSLTWDQTPRLTDWLGDCLGVELNAYSRAMGRNWLLSMVARAFRPGCQADHMPVLEGRMGVGKSSFLEALGAPWYSALPEAFGSKDFLQAIQGQWLIEVPDMAGFSKRDHAHIIAIVTTRTDRYRASYGRHTEDHPRACIFAATSENDDYLQDSRGIRRYWPIRCGSVDLDAFHAQREQLFAEAVSNFNAGASWYEMPDDARSEQEQRLDADPWTDYVRTWIATRNETTAEDVLKYCIEMSLDRIDQAAKKRVGQILKATGQWRSTVRNGSRLWIRRPTDSYVAQRLNDAATD